MFFARTLRPFCSAALAAALLAGCGSVPGGVGFGATRDGDGASALGATTMAKAAAFTLATYNVENLLDGSNTQLDPKSSPTKTGEAKAALAKSLHDLNADVVGLVEVESRATLRKFRDEHLADMGYKYLALVEGNDKRGIDVAVLSRFPIMNIKSHKNTLINVPGSQPQKFSRDLLEARIHPGTGYSFTLFMTHLKSQNGGDAADAKRKAEAMKIRELLRDFEKQHPGDNYALMGDLNDQPDTPAIKVLTDTRGKDALQLTDVLAELGEKAYTYHPSKYRGRIDYILLSPGMRADYKKGSAKIIKSETAEAASDHLPAVVTIDGSQDRKP